MEENGQVYSISNDSPSKASISSNNKNNHYIVKKWSFFHRMFYRSVIPVLANVVPNLFRFEVFGLENLKPFSWNTPIILASNHRSHLDVLVGLSALFTPRGPLQYLTTITYGDVLEKNALFKIIGYLGSHPITRNKPQRSLDYLFETLKIDLPVAIFPQGGRIVRTPLEDYQNLSQEGKSGIGRLVLRTNCKIPVIPVFLHGTTEALSKGNIKPKLGSYLSITFGEPIYFSEYAEQEHMRDSQSYYDTARIITNKIMKEIQKLSYETEKGLFQLLEKKIGKPLKQINLTDRQSRKLRSWLRRYSHIAPYELESMIGT